MSSAFPTGTGLWPESVDIEVLAAQRVNFDPFTMGLSVAEDNAERRHRIVIRMGELPEDLAETFLAWLHALDGMADTFTFDLNPWWQGDDPAPGTRTFRLLPGHGSWDVDRLVLWGINLEAMEEEDDSS